MTETKELSDLTKAKRDLLLHQFDIDYIQDDEIAFEFRLKGVFVKAERRPLILKQLKSIRRYIHLNYDLSVLVFQDDLAFNKTDDNGDPVENIVAELNSPEECEKHFQDEDHVAARILIQSRLTPYSMKPYEYNNLLLVPNPKYENVKETLRHRIREEYDNIKNDNSGVSTDSTTFANNMLLGSNVVITGKTKQKEELEALKQYIADKANGAIQKAVDNDTDLLIIGKNFDPAKLLEAKKRNLPNVKLDEILQNLKDNGLITIEENSND